MTGIIRLWTTSFLLWLLLVGSAHATGFTLTVNVNGSGAVNRDPTNSIIPSGANVILTALSNRNYPLDKGDGLGVYLRHEK
jgi:hypothetical protein